MWVHGLCMILFVTNKFMKSFTNRFEFLRMILQLTKIMAYFLTILKVQNTLLITRVNKSGQITNDNVVARNIMEVLIIFDIAFFYFTIISLIIFNSVVRCRRFHTLRERMIGSIERFKHLRGDSLYIGREDIFWFTVPMSRLCLYAMIEINRS